MNVSNLYRKPCPFDLALPTTHAPSLPFSLSLPPSLPPPYRPPPSLHPSLTPSLPHSLPPTSTVLIRPKHLHLYLSVRQSYMHVYISERMKVIEEIDVVHGWMDGMQQLLQLPPSFPPPLLPSRSRGPPPSLPTPPPSLPLSISSGDRRDV